MNRREFFIAGVGAWLGAPGARSVRAATPKAAELRAGAAVCDVTPAVGVSLNGIIMRLGPVEKVHDRLQARCLVLDDGRTRLAIVVVDVTVVVGAIVDRATALIRQRTGIAAEQVLIAATHTHAAPRMMATPQTDLDREYEQLFCERIAEAVARACERLAPARIGWGTADVPRFTRNRRWFVKPGAMPANPFGGTDDQVLMYGGRKDIGVKPSGPVDPELSVVSLRHADGRPLAVLGNYSVHYVGGYGRATVSSDYVGYLADEMSRALAAEGATPAFVGMMSNGTSGDTGAAGGGYGRMQTLARVLAAEAARVCREATYTTHAPLAVCWAELELGVRRPDDARLEWARTVTSKPRAKGEHPWRNTYAKEAISLSAYPPRVKVRVQAMRIGGLGIAAVPCEVFAETGLAIKKNSPLQPTFTIELANGYHGYLPTPEAHGLGGYETWPARSSCLELDAEPKIRAATLRLLRELADQEE